MKPSYYAIRTPRGFIAHQGTSTWTQDTPKGWAAFCEPDHAQNVLDRFPGKYPDAEIVPIDENDQIIEP